MASTRRVRTLAGHLNLSRPAAGVAPASSDQQVTPQQLTVVADRQLSVDDLMLGTAFMASDAEQSHPDDARKVPTVAYAIECGIKDIDVYPGESELRAADGVAEAARGGRAVDSVRLHTKCDHTIDYFDYTKADALGSHAATQQRLGQCGARLHAMRIHDPRSALPPSIASMII